MSEKRRWLPDELAVVSDLSIDTVDVAIELGRSVGSVATIRKRMASGWRPRRAYVPLTPEQVEFVADHPELTAQSAADELGVPYALVTKARRSLAKERGLSFGTGPYDKNPSMVGQRRLLGKTCSKCGVLRGGADFHRTRSKYASICRFCKSESRPREDPEARERQVRDMAPKVGVEYRENHAQEYAGRDMEVLADPTLTVVEKAARLGRTYAATCMAIQQHGFSSKMESRIEPRGVWIIDAQTQLKAAQEPDRSTFGTPSRKTHCKWGHELTDDNLYYPKNRAPDCLACRRIRNKARAK